MLRTLLIAILLLLPVTAAYGQTTPELTAEADSVLVARHLLPNDTGGYLLAGAAMQVTPPVIRVLGVGRVGMDVATATLAEAQAQGYRAYVGANPAVVVTVTCTGAASPFTCAFPLSQIQAGLSTTQPRSLQVTAFVSAPDGERESARATAPFTLQLAGPPVGPGTAISILPPL